MTKKFLYLVQTDGELPSHYSNINHENADVLYLCWKHPRPGDIYFPNSTWTQGRNKLLEAAKQLEGDYLYYIFLDDDIEFIAGDWRIFEALLLEYQPGIATPQVTFYPTKFDDSVEVQIVYAFDAVFNAFHRDVVADNVLLPYLENFDEESWLLSQLILIHLAGVCYHEKVWQFNHVKVTQVKHRPYPKGSASDILQKEIWLKENIFQDNELVTSYFKDLPTALEMEVLVVEPPRKNYKIEKSFCVNNLKSSEEIWFNIPNGKGEQMLADHQRILARNRDEAMGHFQLAEVHYDRGNWEEASVAYRRAIELYPDWEFYCKLGESLGKQGDLEGAIAAWRHILKLKPDFSHKCFLDSLPIITSFQIKPEQLHIICGQIVSKECLPQITSLAGNEGFVFYGPYISFPDGLYRVCVGFEFPELSDRQGMENSETVGFKFDVVTEAGNCVWYKTDVCTSQKQLEFFVELIDAKQTEFRFLATGVTFSLNFIELSLVYQPRENSAASYYLNLGNTLLQEADKLDKALAACSRAAELNDDCREGAIAAYQHAVSKRSQGTDYFNLGLLLAQQNQLDAALSCYEKALEIQPDLAQADSELQVLLARYCHNLAIRHAEQGRLDEAVACFQKAPQKQPSAGEIYEQIWKGLNQLSPLDETNPYYQTQIEAETAYQYFSKTCPYKILILESLTDGDRIYLENAGLSLAYLELMKQDSAALQSIYINSLGDATTTELSQKVTKTFLGVDYQQSIVDTGYIYSICPVTGKILRSNQSFYVQLFNFLPTGIYRFGGDETFYLMFGCHHAVTLGVYFPKFELIVRFYNDPLSTDYPEVVNELKSGAVSFWREFKSYISSNESKREVAAVVGWLDNLGHYFWNDLTGIQHLSENGTLPKVDKYLIRNCNFLEVGDIFPEIPANDIVRISDRWSLFKTILDNQYMAVRLTEMVVKEKLASRIYEASLKKCSQSFLQEVEKAKTHFPLLWINIRSHNKVWSSQVEGYANIINNLYQDYPNLGLVFDGFSTEKNTVEQILALVPPTVKFYNALDCAIHETIVWAHAINVYIVVIGSGLTLVTWLANKPGVAHGNTVHSESSGWWANVRENAVPPVFIPVECIVDLDASHWAHCDYDFDWKILEGEVNKIVKELRREVKSQQSEPLPNQNSAIHLYELAESYLAQGRLDDAVSACKQALDIQPKFAQAYKTLGNVFQTQGKLDEAKNCYSRALEIQPDFAQALADLGSIHTQQQQ
ncbi:tetratricopeptide repeat protein [Microcoleus sp. herbarium7]|uniref:tetratricopeptide repeat protein n=1 Tax=Microcoleus sp. herbarium7 TaxID=3055435 RepID=UPI002FCE8B69